MYKLKDETVTNIAHLLGVDEESARQGKFEYPISKELSGKIQWPNEKDRRKSCDNPLIALRRFRTMTEVNKRLERIGKYGK